MQRQFGRRPNVLDSANALRNKELAPRVGFEPTACRLTAEMIENLSALSGVAYEKSGAISPSLVAPTPAPTPAADTIPILRNSHTNLFNFRAHPASGASDTIEPQSPISMLRIADPKFCFPKIRRPDLQPESVQNPAP